MITSSDILPKLALIGANNTAMQRLALNLTEELTEGRVIVYDATNPFSLLLECGATMAANALLRNEVLDARQYRLNAKTADDLYLHMSDKDYLDRFSKPSAVPFNFLMYLDELYAISVVIPDTNGVRKLTIPKHTEIIITGYVFTFQYPIDIYLYPNGSVSVLYDTDVLSPIKPLTTNQVKWAITSIGAVKYLSLETDVQQMVITSKTLMVNAINGFTRDFSFQDNYYYCRAFTKSNNSSAWTEIKTTHTDQVYDVKTPTAVLKVVGNTLSVVIPQVYFTNGLISDSVRLDIYTTKGPLDINLSNVDTTSIYARWIDHDVTSLGLYSAPLSKISAISIYSKSTTTGGGAALTLEELRARVVDQSYGDAHTPITPKQLANALNNSGYELVLSKDNISERQYIATRKIPSPVLTTAADRENVLARTALGCSLQKFSTNLINLYLNSTVFNNGNRATITPDTLFISDAGVIKIVPDSVRESLYATGLNSPEALASIANSKSYLYTPYHYVLDVTNNQFNARPYRLNSPVVDGKYFIDSNDSLLIDVSSLTYTIQLMEDRSGYMLLLELQTSEAFKALDLDRIGLQLSYKPTKNADRIFINGALVTAVNPATDKPYNDAYVYGFLIETNFDVDSNHNLIHEPYRTTIPLVSDFDIVYIVKDHSPLGSTVTAIDGLMDASKLVGYNPTSLYRGLAHEVITLHFGDFLDKLLCSSRSVVDSLAYATYPDDVPAVYTETVFARDSVGNLIFSYDANTGNLNETVLFNKGDAVLDGNGVPVMRHLKGDTVLDADGNPTPVDGFRGMLRQLDMLFIDGRYYMATNEATVEYRNQVVDLITEWVLNDLDEHADRLLERSELFFTPKSTIGRIEVYSENNALVTIDAEQTFLVVCYVTKSIAENDAAKQDIRRTITLSITTSLANSTISNADIIANMRTALGSNVVSFDLSGFTGDVHKIVRLRDSSIQPAIGKKLIALSNKTLAIQDAVNVVFKQID